MDFYYKYKKYKHKYFHYKNQYNQMGLGLNLNKNISINDFSFNKFFKFMDNNKGVKKQMEYHMRMDIKQQEGENVKGSVIDMWKNNKKLQQLNTRFVVLLDQNNYIGSFRYYTTEFFSILGIDIPFNVYTKISIVYIVPKYRRKGIAYKVLKDFIDSNKNYVLIVDDHNYKAVELYKKLGFVKHGSNYGNSVLIKSASI